MRWSLVIANGENVRHAPNHLQIPNYFEWPSRRYEITNNQFLSLEHLKNLCIMAMTSYSNDFLQLLHRNKFSIRNYNQTIIGADALERFSDHHMNSLIINHPAVLTTVRYEDEHYAI